MNKKTMFLAFLLIISCNLFASEKIIGNVMFKGVEYQRIFLVDKGARKSYLAEIKNDNFRILKEFDDIIIGQGNGDKHKEGDKKTPTGIYYVINFLPPSKLDKMFGTGAFPLNYPNFIDKLDGKTGHGIWIHGRNPLEKKQASKGCVVLHNEDIEYLKTINFLYTPVIITEHLTYTDPINYNAEKSYWLNFLNEFLQSWQNNDINRLSKLIHVRFRDSNYKSYAEYIKKKKMLMELFPKKTIIFDNIKIYKENETEVVFDFDQYYAAPNLTTFGTKRLYLIKEIGDFKIIAEEYADKYPVPQKYRQQAITIAKNEQKQEKQEKESKQIDKEKQELKVGKEEQQPKPEKQIKTEKVEKPTIQEEKNNSQDNKKIEQFVHDWAKAWESKDIEKYMSFYDENFKAGKMNYAAWKKDKNGKFSRIKNISVDISDMKITKKGNSYEVSFVQLYKTEALTNKGIKKLIINDNNNSYKIVYEGWRIIK